MDPINWKFYQTNHLILYNIYDIASSYMKEISLIYFIKFTVLNIIVISSYIKTFLLIICEVHFKG